MANNFDDIYVHGITFNLLIYIYVLFVYTHAFKTLIKPYRDLYIYIYTIYNIYIYIYMYIYIYVYIYIYICLYVYIYTHYVHIYIYIYSFTNVQFWSFCLHRQSVFTWWEIIRLSGTFQRSKYGCVLSDWEQFMSDWLRLDSFWDAQLNKLSFWLK